MSYLYCFDCKETKYGSTIKRCREKNHRITFKAITQKYVNDYNNIVYEIIIPSYLLRIIDWKWKEIQDNIQLIFDLKNDIIIVKKINLLQGLDKKFLNYVRLIREQQGNTSI
ncbi:MAG: hypothetical protein QXM68_02155 [Candidatus Aenigmatarchaeota archaeon]|nr:hypothetical protein [Candidatus Aenigmarchaeota archaeon]